MPHQIVKMLIFFTLLFTSNVYAKESSESNELLQRPLMERYILDELKDLRQSFERLRSDTQIRVAQAEVSQTDRSARYITDTVGNIFYIIAAATSILIFAGWNSLRDIKKKSEEHIEQKIEEITKKYNEELELLQKKLTEQSKKIIDNQNRIYNTQLIHSLWMRANLETNPQSKIEIYDEILSINKDDPEVYAYKADAVLDLDEYEWALNLSNKAIDLDDNYGYAYWQRSCANAKLNNIKDALSDLKVALSKAPNLKDEMVSEPSFIDLKELKEFKEIVK